MSPLPQSVIVLTTTSKQEDAQRIARQLVERRLAACVQVEGPIESVYRWKGNIDCDTEWRCVIKTTAAAYAHLEAQLRQLHPYEQPQILRIDATAEAGYHAWLADATAPEKTP